ncbi:MAG: LLM class flavin-dependent oxidoreductase [Anaerolineaceae bacterium]|nr:LLM class flavin-dependent oxidoreductase [Anaerolineaceae bacterium]
MPQRDLQFSFGSNGAPTIREQIALARAAESHGFSHFSAFDDLFFRPAWPTLFSVAQHTTRVGLGPSVVNPYLTHPALIAEYAAILEEVAPGRAYLGIGRGAFLEEIHVEISRPLRALREAIALIRQLWAGNAAAYEGEIFSLRPGAALHFPPPARAIPIMLGTWGERGARLSGELADELKAGSLWSVRYAQHLWQHIREGSERAGRHTETCGLVLGPLTAIAEDHAAAAACARQTLVFYLPYLAPMPQFLGMEEEQLSRIQARQAEGDLPGAAALISDDLLQEFALFGTPGDVIASIERTAAETALTRVEFGMPHGPDGSAAALQLLGERVLPHFSR